MALENVDTSSLRNALTQCKNSINHNTTNELINNISNNSIWETTAQTNLKKALTKLVNERYKNLENKINEYFNIVSNIEKYQNLQKENKNLEYQYYNLSNEYKKNATISDNAMQKDSLKDKNKINNINKKIYDNKAEMENIKNRISNSI